jgi:uncharacterized protein (TIGR03435 family)
MTRHGKFVSFLLAALMSIAALPVFSQQVGGIKRSFEVASVKPSADGEVRTYGPRPGDRFVAIKCTVKTVIALAYNVREDKISGGPNWIGTDTWSIEAKAEEGSIPTGTWPDPAVPDHPLTLMVQSLLEDRFHLKVRKETRELPVYELMVVKNGPKMMLTARKESDRHGVPSGAMRLNPAAGFLWANGVPVSRLAEALSEPRILGRPVIDKTGLNGLYDFTLEWSPEPGLGPVMPVVSEPRLPSDASSRPPNLVAIQEQLGLKVESAKAPVGVLVIDNIERPTKNQGTEGIPMRGPASFLRVWARFSV